MHAREGLSDNRPMAQDRVLLARIRELVDEPIGAERARLLARIEHTLTDGYARALALEAERMRLERQIGVVAAQLSHGDSARKAAEISALATRLSDADGDLAELRELLQVLRRRAADVRAVA
jgi:hypothetical protein